MEHTKAKKIEALRSRIARMQAADAANRRAAAICFGLQAIDDLLPGNGLPAALHEVAGIGPEAEHGAASALFLAGVLARCEGTVLWVQEWPRCFCARTRRRRSAA